MIVLSVPQKKVHPGIAEGTLKSEILEKLKTKYSKQPIDTIDGVRIEFDDNWVHLRKSNTEPIIRIYAESETRNMADNLAKKILQDIGEFTKN